MSFLAIIEEKIFIKLGWSERFGSQYSRKYFQKRPDVKENGKNKMGEVRKCFFQ